MLLLFRVRLAIALIATVFAFWTCAATATIAPERWQSVPAAKARLVGVRFARCVVRSNPQAVSEYLNVPVGKEASFNLARAFPSECFITAPGPAIFLAPGAAIPSTNQLGIPLLLLRGLLYDELLARGNKQALLPISFEGTTAAEYLVAGPEGADRTLQQDYRALMKIGDCTVRAQPAAVQRLLQSSPGGKPERRALSELRLLWLPCLPGRRDLAFSDEMVRATVAEPFYKLVVRASNRH